MFASLKTIDTAFKQVKMLAALFIVSVLVFALFIAYLSFENSATAANHIYLLQNGQLLTADAHDGRADRVVEAKSHVQRFHELFFSLDPDEKAIDKNIRRALYFADNSAKREYENLKERGFYNDLIAAGISQEITVDSVVLSKTNPLTARTYAHEQLVRATSVSNKELITDCSLRNVTRSENNPHGFIMENWRVVQNTVTSTVAR
jgi:conjugative transposon TraK protein